MFTADRFRAKAAEYTEKLESAADPNEIRDLRRLEQSFVSLAQNEDWLANNLDKIIRLQDTEVAESGDKQAAGKTAVEIEEHILRCLGAAVMLQWNNIPTKLQRDIFDAAGSMGELLRTSELRGRIARFLHRHNAD